MVCLQNETPLTLNEARKRCPTRPDISTIWRWAVKGCRGVKLETYVFPGRRLTTVEALDRFRERTELAATGSSPARGSAPNARMRQKQQAEAKRRKARL